MSPAGTWVRADAGGGEQLQPFRKLLSCGVFLPALFHRQHRWLLCCYTLWTRSHGDHPNPPLLPQLLQESVCE